ncbi:hypothetical protein BJX62DRAFT_208843, partial [Aspergillus germanicus]
MSNCPVVRLRQVERQKGTDYGVPYGGVVYARPWGRKTVFQGIKSKQFRCWMGNETKYSVSMYVGRDCTAGKTGVSSRDYSRCGIIVSGVSRPRWVQWAALETGTPRWARERLKSTNTLVCQAFSEQGGRPGESYVPRKPFSIGPCHVRAWRGFVGNRMCVWTLGCAFCTVRGALGTAGHSWAVLVIASRFLDYFMAHGGL